ncbi:MAG: hypothetical protein MUP13_18150 [Thermoanaerobaculales bacterium]|nr:hypothetical protein [Thermoanaerobaculales bacterium]
MPRIVTIVVTVAIGVLLAPGAAASNTTCPIVPNNVGHWLNLEYRSGTLAPEIADNPRLALTILVVDRSLAKIDAVAAERDRGSPCLDLLLPYVRLTHEIATIRGDDGGVTESVRPVRVPEQLDVRVCTGIDRRTVAWVLDDALYLVSRTRAGLGNFPRTYYSIYHVTADELARTLRRNARLTARGKDPRPPQFKTLYRPPGDIEPRRTLDSLFAFFGAEFSQTPILTERNAERGAHTEPKNQPLPSIR